MQLHCEIIGSIEQSSSGIKKQLKSIEDAEGVLAQAGQLSTLTGSVDVKRYAGTEQCDRNTAQQSGNIE